MSSWKSLPMTMCNNSCRGAEGHHYLDMHVYNTIMGLETIYRINALHIRISKHYLLFSIHYQATIYIDVFSLACPLTQLFHWFEHKIKLKDPNSNIIVICPNIEKCWLTMKKHNQRMWLTYFLKTFLFKTNGILQIHINSSFFN